MTYDDWKTETPEDEYERLNPHPHGGAYTVKVTCQFEATIEVEVEAGDEADALDDAIIQAKRIPFELWSVDQNDYDAAVIDDTHRAR